MSGANSLVFFTSIQKYGPQLRTTDERSSADLHGGSTSDRNRCRTDLWRGIFRLTPAGQVCCQMIFIVGTCHPSSREAFCRYTISSGHQESVCCTLYPTCFYQKSFRQSSKSAHRSTPPNGWAAILEARPRLYSATRELLRRLFANHPCHLRAAHPTNRVSTPFHAITCIS